ncbi:MAG TPA: hypothetical protein VKT78_06330, partial [Fimbriimonadaceae bacterium]|nr:hypothetical protein [Fimbriimonadaceae bacterium]
PPVLIDGGGASSGVEDGVNGILVRNDAAAFATAINGVLANDDLLARLSDHAVKSVRGSGPSVMADRVLEVYEAVLGARDGSGARAYVSVK